MIAAHPVTASFNPRARVGRDHRRRPVVRGLPRFNPRARVGRDPGRPAPHVPAYLVSIHAPAWGATSFLLIEFTRSGFVSIHAPAWGATTDAGLSSGACRVSIHAPAWGATRLWRSAAWWETVSIHAPAWGATQVLQRLLWALLVSIHAPAWGATRRTGNDAHASDSFNPRARVGRDGRSTSSPLSILMFQSTRPRGARLVGVSHRDNEDACFNPRARVGRDPPSIRQGSEGLRVSIHAPAWGATGGNRGRDCC